MYCIILKNVVLLHRQTKKTTMKRILLIGLILWITGAAEAQIISGKVVDGATGQPVAYATISLMNADSTLLSGAITDE